MSILFDLVLLLLVVFFLPYIVVGFVIGKLLAEVVEWLYLPALFGAVGAAGLAVLTWLNSAPDATRPWVSLVESFSQGSALGVATPVWCVLLSVGLFVGATSKGWSRLSRRTA